MKKYFSEFIGTSFTGMGIHRRTIVGAVLAELIWKLTSTKKEA